MKVRGRCENCEAIYESPVAFENLNSIDTLPDFNNPGPKIEVNGIIYKSDGKTPASDVILYIYHTDQEGVYPKKGNEKGLGKLHGYIRGWVKTDKNGMYKFYTLVPASYPNSNNPKHIHVIIKEEGKSEYWIDDFLFSDDTLISKDEITNPKGGNGILETINDGNKLIGKRNIYLGKNIANYPE